ncbi:GMC oxidoreductase [Roseovarius sp. SYSU LYC5161]|jgi:choline dehydrogenase|uniref:GMC oxidoreductase n=1 Tax=Roseovarius halophilus (ex Wu et al. 2025) TaxID=3376060 RepID=UPI0028719354|nr:GMC oxidoreductase [Roseovarius sp.]
MGTDDAAVVDSFALRFNGVENLYAADASVTPRMVSGDTRAAAIAIAERAAPSVRNGGRGSAWPCLTRA